MTSKVTLPAPVVITIVAVILAVVIVPLFVTAIDAGETGVVVTFGSVSDNALLPGLSLKNPFSNIVRFSTRTEEYTMSAAPNEGVKAGDDSVEARASDGALVYADVTVLYHIKINEAPRIYKELGEDFQSKILRPVMRSAVREVIAQYPVGDIYSIKRDEIAKRLKEKISEATSSRGIEIEDTLLRDVKLTQTLTNSIEQKLTAQQEAQKLEFLLEREKKEAERKVIEAKGQRDAQAIINESLSDRYLYYLYIISLKDRQGTIYVPTEGGVPLFKNVQ